MMECLKCKEVYGDIDKTSFGYTVKLSCEECAEKLLETATRVLTNKEQPDE